MVDRKILAFSVSHDWKMVQIYGHFARISGPKTTYHRQLISVYDMRAVSSKERWTSFDFITSLYQHWVPEHLRRLCSKIDQLPENARTETSQSEKLPVQDTSPSVVEQNLEASQSSGVKHVDASSNTSVSQGTKKSKRRKR